MAAGGIVYVVFVYCICCICILYMLYLYMRYFTRGDCNVQQHCIYTVDGERRIVYCNVQWHCMNTVDGERRAEVGLEIVYIL